MMDKLDSRASAAGVAAPKPFFPIIEMAVESIFSSVNSAEAGRARIRADNAVLIFLLSDEVKLLAEIKFLGYYHKSKNYI